MKITLDYYRYRNDATPDWGVPLRNSQNTPTTEFGILRNTWVGMKNLDFFKERADIGTATIVAKLAEGVTLTNRSRAGESRNNYVATSMEGYPDVHHPNRDQTARIYSNQTELNLKFNTVGIRHNMVAGVEISREEIERNSYSVTNLFDNTRPFPANPYAYTDRIVGKNRVYDAKIDTVGVYLTDTIRLSDQWIVNGGIRYDDFKREQIGGSTQPANTASVEAGLFSWNAGIVYKPIPIASFYVAYATAQSPIGSELDSNGAQYNGISSTLVRVKPQEARSVEVGTKWELFNKRLLATAAVFQTDVDHARTNDGVTATNNANAYRGEYRVRGIELGAAGNITRDWSVYGGLTLLDTEVLDSSTQQDIGRRLANIPLRQFSMLSKYQLTDKFGGCGNGDLWRRDTWWSFGRQYSEQPYSGLVAFRRLRRIQADVERQDHTVGSKSYQRIVLRCLVSVGRLFCIRRSRPGRVPQCEGALLTPGVRLVSCPAEPSSIDRSKALPLSIWSAILAKPIVGKCRRSTRRALFQNRHSARRFAAYYY